MRPLEAASIRAFILNISNILLLSLRLWALFSHFLADTLICCHPHKLSCLVMRRVHASHMSKDFRPTVRQTQGLVHTPVPEAENEAFSSIFFSSTLHCGEGFNSWNTQYSPGSSECLFLSCQSRRDRKCKHFATPTRHRACP